MKQLTIIMLSCLLISCASFAELAPTPPTADEYALADFGAYPSNYQEMIQNYMGQMFLDPYSAVYRFAPPEKRKAGNRYGYYVRTTINAKNRMGGYTGAKNYSFMIHNNEIWRCFTQR